MSLLLSPQWLVLASFSTTDQQYSLLFPREFFPFPPHFLLCALYVEHPLSHSTKFWSDLFLFWKCKAVFLLEWTWALDSDRSTLKSHDFQLVSSFFSAKRGEVMIKLLGEDGWKNYMTSHVNALRWSIHISFPFTTQIALLSTLGFWEHVLMSL